MNATARRSNQSGDGGPAGLHEETLGLSFYNEVRRLLLSLVFCARILVVELYTGFSVMKLTHLSTSDSQLPDGLINIAEFEAWAGQRLKALRSIDRLMEAEADKRKQEAGIVCVIFFELDSAIGGGIRARLG